MFSADQYQLLDFGDGRKLERMSSRVLDRPCPAAEGERPSQPRLWNSASARFERGESASDGVWLPPGSLPASWKLHWRSLTFELKPTPFGHVGIFPEQAENWAWLSELIANRVAAGQPVRMLNLFAYTGAATLAAAAAGAAVVHVDAARNVVGWARTNAELSGHAGAPIRWLTEDAALFAARERKRGRSYEFIVLDPPSYGHGPKGQTWNLQRDLPNLLADCAAILADEPIGVLLSCHSPGFGPGVLKLALAHAGFSSKNGGCTAADLFLKTLAGRKLHAGAFARWTVEQPV